MANRSRFFPPALLSALAATLVLAACGGSDAPADGAPPPVPTEPDTTAPVLAFTTPSPIAVDGSITVGSDEPLADGAEIRVMTGDIITVPGTVSLAADRRSFTWTPAAPLRYEMELEVFAGASDPSGNQATTLHHYVHTVDPPSVPPWWPPARIAPVGTRVAGANPLPAGCTGWPATCYKDAVRDGTVQFLQAGGGSEWDGRPVIFGFYRMVSPGDGVTPWWSLMPENLDDGWRPNAGTLAIAWLLPWNSTREIDWVVGSAEGLIVHDAASGACTEYVLPGAVPRSVDCP